MTNNGTDHGDECSVYGTNCGTFRSTYYYAMQENYGDKTEVEIVVQGQNP